MRDVQHLADPVEVVAHELAVVVRRAESARLRAQPLDRSAYLLLDAVVESEAPALGSLADLFQLDLSTVSRQVATLEAKGLVERGADPGDGRVTQLSITREGSSQLQITRAARHDFFTKLLADWSDEDIRSLGEALHHLNLCMARLGKLPVSLSAPSRRRRKIPRSRTTASGSPPPRSQAAR